MTGFMQLALATFFGCGRPVFGEPELASSAQ
jgi:hypothetical protein